MSIADDFYAEVDADLSSWQLAVAAAHRSNPARIAVISDSLCELSGERSGDVLWPHRIGLTPGVRFIPASPSWDLSVNGGNFWFPADPGQPAQAAVVNGSQSSPTSGAAAIRTPQVVLDAVGESVTFDVFGTSVVRLVYRYDWGTSQDPFVYWDGVPSSGWTQPGVAFADDLVISYPITVQEHSALSVTVDAAAGSPGTVLVGAFVQYGDSPVEVLNLGRASSTALDWDTWLRSASGPQTAYASLLRGFQPDLVVLPSSGNDFIYNNSITQAQLNARLTSLKNAVRDQVPGVSVAIPTNPDFPAFGAGLVQYNNWIRAWGVANADYVLDWAVQLPQGPATIPNSTEFYLSDGIHLRATGHGRVADYAREVLLPVVR